MFEPPQTGGGSGTELREGHVESFGDLTPGKAAEVHQLDRGPLVGGKGHQRLEHDGLTRACVRIGPSLGHRSGIDDRPERARDRTA